MYFAIVIWCVAFCHFGSIYFVCLTVLQGFNRGYEVERLAQKFCELHISNPHSAASRRAISIVIAQLGNQQGIAFNLVNHAVLVSDAS